MKMPIPTAMSVAVRTSRATAPQISEVPEHQHVNQHREGLDRELRHREIGRAEHEEGRRDAVADRAEREHGRHGGSRMWRRCSGDDDEDDEDVMGGDARARHRGRREPEPSRRAPCRRSKADVATMTMT